MTSKLILLFICLLSLCACKKKDPIQYELVTAVLPAGGGTVSPLSGFYKEGETVVITATPNPEFLFIGWSEGAIGATNPLTVVMNSIKHITASFEKRKYPLSITIEGDGTVKEEIVQNKSVTDYSSGTVVKLTAIPNNGAEFVGWSGDYTGNDNPVVITIDRAKSVKIQFQKSYVKFISKAPKYTYPNNTVGQIKRNACFPGFYDINEGKKYNIYGPVPGENGEIISGCQYGSWNGNSTYIDLDNNGRLDYFAFLLNSVTQPSAKNGGKYVVVRDVLDPNPDIKYFDCSTRWPPSFEINDMNNDGFNEIIQASSDGHNLADGTNGLESPLKILYFKSDGSYTVQEIGTPMGIHDFASGDIDRDGDIDILVWRYNTKIPDSMPLLFINDGKGNFTIADGNRTFKGIDEIVNTYVQYVVLAVELCDLNNDGNLDIITGQCIGQDRSNSRDDYKIPNCRIYWGNSEGTFDLKSNFSDLPNTSISDMSFTNIVLGFSFLDYDNDGDMDVFVVSSPSYGGFYLQLYENMGNGKFLDVTNTKVTGFSYNYSIRGFQPGDFPIFNNIRLYDKDNDGDYDLVPDVSAPPLPIVTNMFWENVGGTFVRRNF